MIKERYLHHYVTSDLKEKMVFIGGPRQVGKTTLARFIGKKDYQSSAYLNWDNREDRKNIVEGKFSSEARLLIFDEIHKYKLWENYIKGLFDKYKLPCSKLQGIPSGKFVLRLDTPQQDCGVFRSQNKNRFDVLITGSARLDLYRRGGDSLMGRYQYYRLHPFSLREALQLKPALKILKELEFLPLSKNITRLFNELLHFGGFPEPFIKQEERTLRRFHNERLDRLVREDIRDIELVRDLSALQLLVEILPGKVGSLLSLNSLQEDLQVTHKTISSWMDILERFYYHFRIYPFTASRIKSLRKQPKMFLWDWSQVEDKSARLENIVAANLLKMIHFLYDAEGYKAELYFLRDLEGREVDFLVVVDKKPWMAVEIKSADKSVSSHLKYFGARLNIPFMYQVVGQSGVDFIKDNIRVISVDKFLSALV